ncbi:MAG: glycosyltransferase family 2 protein [Bacteroides sp.]|nr:glycosyltransferase family 2 protein [Bacteroides sp.]
MRVKKLSVIIPTYNEAKTIGLILEKVIGATLPNDLTKEIIIVDDCSTDETEAEVQSVKRTCGTEMVYIKLPENRGKGYAVRTGIVRSTGEVVVVQDADLEYDPRDFATLIQLILSGKSRVVYGSRILNKENSYSYHSFYWGGRLVSLVTTLLYGQHITDEPTCYKMFDAALLKEITLTSNRFGFCPEVTAKVIRMRHRIEEVPISYYPRAKEEGKKIKWRDGVEALWLLLKFRLVPMKQISPAKQESTSTGKWLVRNLLALVMALGIVYLAFSTHPTYQWVYGNLLKKNHAVIKKAPQLTFDQKMLMKLGESYRYLHYLRNATPPNAVILYPPKKAFQKEGTPFKHEIFNKAFATRFLYPRRLVLEEELGKSPLASRITHIAIVNGEGANHFTHPTDSTVQNAVFEISLTQPDNK